MRGALLLPVLGLGGCFRTEGFECTFRDEAVADNATATNGMSGDDVRAAMISTTTFDAAAVEERPEDNPTLALDQARSLGLSGRVIKEREKMA